MTDASAETFAKPTPALVGSAPSAVRQSISTGTATRLPVNDEDPAGTQFLKLIQAHHAAGRRNMERLAASMQALSTAKTPAAFVELQRQLLAETIAAAVSDRKAIGKLTAEAFSAAFNPMRRKIGELRDGAKRQE
jgi:hypothetical protein